MGYGNIVCILLDYGVNEIIVIYKVCFEGNDKVV